MKLTIGRFEEYSKERLKKILKDGEETTIVAGFIDVFGDSKLTLCINCGTPAYVRPWLMDAIENHNMRVVCVCCAPPEYLQGQLVMDLAAIQNEEEVRLSAEGKDDCLQYTSCRPMYVKGIREEKYSYQMMHVCGKCLGYTKKAGSKDE